MNADELAFNEGDVIEILSEGKLYLSVIIVFVVYSCKFLEVTVPMMLLKFHLRIDFVGRGLLALYPVFCYLVFA